MADLETIKSVENDYRRYPRNAGAEYNEIYPVDKRHLFGEEPILIRSMGGSIPIAPIIDALGVPAATVPTVNIDNNQHSPNENLRLGNFVEGIAILMSVLSQSPD